MSQPIAPRFKYDSLNTLKALACIGVILKHCQFPGFAGRVVAYLMKFNVPCFFLISGFFLYSLSETSVIDKSKRQIAKILKLLAISFILYGPVFCLIDCLGPNNLTFNEWFTEELGWHKIPQKILVGSFFNGSLWYLHSLFWAYVLLIITSKFFKPSKMLWLAPVLLILHIILRIYAKIEFADIYDAAHWRSFLHYALPFMLLGYTCAKYKEFILSRLSDRVLIAIAVIGCMMQFGEYAIHKQSLDIYFGTIFYALALFAIALRHPKEKLNNFLNYVGEKLSMPIYIVHVGAITILLTINAYYHINPWIMPFLAIILSYVFALIWRRIADKQKS